MHAPTDRLLLRRLAEALFKVFQEAIVCLLRKAHYDVYGALWEGPLILLTCWAPSDSCPRICVSSGRRSTD